VRSKADQMASLV